MSENFVATHHQTPDANTELSAPLKLKLPLRQSISEDTQSPEEVPISQYNEQMDSTTHVDLEILQENITDAIKAAYSQNSMYSRVFVLLVYWDDEVSDRKHMGPTARKLGETFKRLFDYDVEEFPIPSRNSFSKMTSKLLQVQDTISDEENNNLFILYYGGHASFKSRGHDIYQEAFWHPSVAAAVNPTGKSVGIELSSIESLLVDFDSDIFFLFDCCFATGMIQRDRKWKKQCEILGASGSLEKACGEKDKSFTGAVINLLEQQMEGSYGTSVVGLINKLKDRQYLRSLPNRLTTTPDYAVLSQAHSSPIRLIPLKTLPFSSSSNEGSISGSSTNTLIDTFDDSDARVLLSIAISGMPAIDALIEFFNHRPSTFTRIESTSYRKDDLKLHGLFNSDSMMAIVSMPTWLWYLLPQSGGYHYIGIVRSRCLLRGESGKVEIQKKALYCNAEVQTETWKILSRHHSSLDEDKQSLVSHSREEQEVRLEQAMETRRVGSMSRLESDIYGYQKPKMATRDKGLDQSEAGEVSTKTKFSLSPKSGVLPPQLPPGVSDSGIKTKRNSYKNWLHIRPKKMSWLQRRPKKRGTRTGLFLNAGADVNIQGVQYGNTLQAAAASDQDSEAVVQLLLSAGADFNAKGGGYGNALQAAAYLGSEVVVQLLLDDGADVNAQGGQYGNALQAAAASDQDSEAVIKLLLNAGADVNAKGGGYGNALQAAAYLGTKTIVQLLLDAGANVNAQGGYYGNALQAAAYRGSEVVVQLLLNTGADVNAQGGYYGYALQAATIALYQGSEAVVQLLLNAGADVNAKGGYYGNALQAAAYLGSKTIVRLLLNSGADVNAQGGYYGNALQAAAYLGLGKIMQLLLDAGADVNAQGGHYGNALQAAAYRGSKVAVQMLLDAGADVDAEGGQYGNVIQAVVAAAYQGSEVVVQLLLDAGADFNAQGGQYDSSLQAVKYQDSETSV